MSNTVTAKIGLVDKGTYSASTTYASNMLAHDADDTIVYKSKVDNNVGHALTDTNYWKVWVKSPAGAYLYYGVKIDPTVASPTLERIGNTQMHRDLPIQSKMRRCLVTADGQVTYLSATNSNYLEDNVTEADLTGASGNVMVEIPEYYRRFVVNADGTFECRLSAVPMTDFEYIPKRYVAAFEANVQSNVMKSIAGVLATTNISLTNYRTYGKAVGTNWYMYQYFVYKDIFWLFATEYATLNSQLAINNNLTAEGFRQGGLGNGVSNISSSDWSTYNGYNPIYECGATLSLGNKTGEVEQTKTGNGVTLTAKVNSYRGIENPFGHIWKWTDGMLAVADGTKIEAYVCDDPTKTASSKTSDYQLRGLMATTNGYAKTMILGEHGDILTQSVGGGSSTYYSDYYYCNVSANTYGLLLGGYAYYGTSVGLGCVNVSSVPSSTNANIGSRLCYLPNS